ncbi:MAG: Holliday junction resolvase RuvX [Clostridium sp.]|nr:Holliday junction resolvase RuvX [Clostridium sp.]
MRIMGVDYGDSRIGIALSDPLGWTAQGLETIRWKMDIEVPVERILRLIKEYSIERIIVGFPKNMDGSIGFRGEKTTKFIEILKERIGDIKIIKWDERLTTVAAQRTMHEMGIKSSKKKQVVDQIAAVYILQGYLDSLGNNTTQ